MTPSTISSEIQVLRALRDILPEWEQLFRRCSDATPFQSPEWLLPWWDVFGAGAPLVIAARRGDRLAGLGLFYIYEGDPEHPNQLYLIGKSVSDYLDILVADDQPGSELAQQIIDSVFRMNAIWQSADLDHLRANSPLLSVRARAGISEHRVQQGVCPELFMNGTSMSQIAKKNTRDSIRKHRNRARGMGSIEFVTADRQSFPLLMDHLVRLHSAHWQSAGLPGVFSDPRMIRFLEQAGWRLLESGKLRLQAMLVNGQPIAVAFGIMHQGRNYFYLCDFDIAYASISPGTLLTAYAIEQAAADGAKYFDFMQGEEEYKFVKWGAQPRHTWRIRYWHE